MKKYLIFLTLFFLFTQVQAQKIRSVELKREVYSFESLISETSLKPIADKKTLQKICDDVLMVPELFGLSPNSSIFFFSKIADKYHLSGIRWKKVDNNGNLIVEKILVISIDSIPKGSIIMGY